ncbi:hypothetical protein KKA47_04460 [bacterium]|nr:hypothetical protein [bacterium]
MPQSPDDGEDARSESTSDESIDTDDDNLVEPTPLRISTEHRSVVYLLPSGLPEEIWMDKYPKGKTKRFYVFEDLADSTGLVDYPAKIRSDFEVISQIYNTVIIIVPSWDTAQYYKNLEVMNDYASEYNMNIMFAIFPDDHLAPGVEYLNIGSPKNEMVKQNIAFMSQLSQTWKIALWYGWTSHGSDPQDIVDFHSDLPDEVKPWYALWLDGSEYIEPMQDIAVLLPELFVVTERYGTTNMDIHSTVFQNQMIVTGWRHADNPTDWLAGIKQRTDLIAGLNRYLGVWIFYDYNGWFYDNEPPGGRHSAYFPNYIPSMLNLWE